MQVLIRSTDRIVLQYGESIGELAGAVILEIDAQVLGRILVALALPNGGVRLELDLTVTTLPPVLPPDLAALRSKIITLAQSSVGVTLDALSANQRAALTAALLYLAGAVDPVTLTVRPLNQWLLIQP